MTVTVCVTMKANQVSHSRQLPEVDNTCVLGPEGGPHTACCPPHRPGSK